MRDIITAGLIAALLLLSACQGYRTEKVYTNNGVDSAALITCLNSHTGLVLTQPVKQSVYNCAGGR